jgi:group I intron endonuclease
MPAHANGSGISGQSALTENAAMVEPTIIRTWLVYKITCLVTSKLYVGLTGTPLTERWAAHVRNANRKTTGMLIGAAIRKYGAEAFRVECLETCTSKPDACSAERRWISTLRTQAPHGYNITAGGNAGNGGAPWSEERKAAWRERMKNWRQPPHVIAKVAAKLRGRKLAAYHAAIIRIAGRANKGMKHTAATVRAVLLTKLRGRIQTPSDVSPQWGCALSRNRFRATITRNQKRLEIGSYATLVEASIAYQAALRRRIEEVESGIDDPFFETIRRPRGQAMKEAWQRPGMRERTGAAISRAKKRKHD